MFKAVKSSRRRRNQLSGRDAFHRRLMCEPLEDRRLLSVGLSAWVRHDLNRDGSVDHGDQGFQGVTVQVYSSTDAVIGNSDDVLLASGTTLSDGYYNSGWLPDGTGFYMKVIAPTGCTFAAQKSDYNDVDASGTTALFTAPAGEYVTRNALLASTSSSWAVHAGSISGSSCGNAVARDAAGNVYVTGYFSGAVDFDPGPGQTVLSSASQRAFVAKYSPDGALVWAKDLSPLAANNGVDITVDAHGSVFATGSFCDNTGGGFFVTKLNSNGDALWTKTVSLPGYQTGVDNRDCSTGIVLDYQGSVLVSGCFSGAVDFNPGSETFNLTSAGDQDAFVLKLTSNGDFAWVDQSGGSGYDAALDIAIKDGWWVYTTGSSGSNCFVRKLDIFGNLQWTVSTSGPGSAVGTGISVSPDNYDAVCVGGYFQGTVDFDPGDGVFNLAGETGANYSVFTMTLWPSLGGFNWAGDVGESCTAPTVDVHVMFDRNTCVSYLSTTNSTPDSANYACSYKVFDVTGGDAHYGGSPWGATPLFSLPGSNSQAPLGHYGGGLAVGDDWTICVTGSFGGSANVGIPGQNLVSVGEQDIFVSQFTPQVSAISNLRLDYKDYVDNQQPAGTLIGTFSQLDPLGSTFQYSLVPGSAYVMSSDDDNACFVIDGNQLKTTAAFSYAGKDMYYIRVRVTDEHGQWTENEIVIDAIDHASPKVTINQATDQTDPAADSPIHFTVVFSEDVNDFTAADVTLGGTAPGSLEVTVTAVNYDYSTYDVLVRGMSGPGTVVASIAAGAARDRCDNPSLASTSTDNSVLYTAGSQFEDFGSRGLPGVGFGAAVWGDYDNDGRLDVLMAGHAATNDGLMDITRIYHNDGNGFFHDISAGLLGVSSAALAWGDYDNDGRLDIILTGNYMDWTNSSSIAVTKLYHNDGNGVFREVSTSLPSVTNASVAWVDYDGDGRLDLFLGGTTTVNSRYVDIARLYHNDGNGVFHDVTAGLPEGANFSPAWGDYDNDGRLDLVASVDDGITPECVRLYHNDGNGVFREVSNGLGLAGTETRDPVWGDFDNDGQLDILISVKEGDVWNAVVCHNDGNGAFHAISTGLPVPIGQRNIAWGDYDKDGRLDILMNSASAAVVYHNDGDGSFHDIAINLPGTYAGTAQWGDYNNDGRLDILLCGMDSQLEPYTRIYQNSGPVIEAQPAALAKSLYASSLPLSELVSSMASAADDAHIDENTPPAAPTNLKSQRVSATYMVLSWDAASDAETPANGLSYALRVGTTPGGSDIVSPATDASGLRRLVEHGMIQGTSWTLNGLTPGKSYYWSVQAVDTSFAGSAFATEEDAIFNPITFVLASPTSGTFVAGQDVSVQWTADNVPEGSKVSLCYDEDATWWNGNEHWIEIDQMAAADGDGSYNWNTTGMKPGKYYIAGYEWTGSVAIFSHLTQAITIQGAPAPTFTLTSPTSGTFTAGQDVSVQWKADNVRAGSKISLCYDEDTTWWNGNEHWIEVDQASVANGIGSYNWNTAGLKSGTYYLAGYLWTGSAAVFSHLAKSIIVQGVPSPTFTLTSPTSGTFIAGQDVSVQWTAANVPAGSKVSLCYDEDKTWWNGNEHWIEVDQASAANGIGSYNWNTAGLKSGTYYLAGYLWTGNSAVFARLAQTITIQPFTLTGPASKSCQVGDNVQIRWTANGVAPGNKISLCYDEDTTWWNGNEHWIEVDQLTTYDGSYFTVWNTAGLTPGNYYIAGYMYDGVSAFTFSHLTQPVALAAGGGISAGTMTLNMNNENNACSLMKTGAGKLTLAGSTLIMGGGTLALNGNDSPENKLNFGSVMISNAASGASNLLFSDGNSQELLVKYGEDIVPLGNTLPAFYASFTGGNILALDPAFGQLALLAQPGQTPRLYLIQNDSLGVWDSFGAGPLETPPSALSMADVLPIAAEAKDRIMAALGKYAEQNLPDLTFELADLPAGVLVETRGTTLRIDRDAAGFGWFIDSTPQDDAEYSFHYSPVALQSFSPSPAYQRADLLSAVMLEMGHELGLDQSSTTTPEWMAGHLLSVGMRRLPSAV